jgi:hypothetical protein
VRIFLLGSKIKAQIEALDYISSINGKAKLQKDQENNPKIRDLFERVTENKEKPLAILKSLRVSYNDKDLWSSSNPLDDEKEMWVNLPHAKTTDNIHRVCRDCEYKQGTEEVLNMLSVCGFIKKLSKREPDFPPVAKEPSMEPFEEKEDNDDRPKSENKVQEQERP